MTKQTRKRPPTAHRIFRRQRGPLTIAPYPDADPQYQTGPRRGQQLAHVRKLTSEFNADRIP